MPLIAIETETWKPCAGHELSHLVSDAGRVRNIKTGNILKPRANKVSGHMSVVLCANGNQSTVNVHALVAETFLGPKPDGMEIRHYDDDPSNNHVANLIYGSRSENQLDMVRNGKHHYARRTHCKHGHEYTPENTALRLRRFKFAVTRSRVCLTCQRLGGRKDGAR